MGLFYNDPSNEEFQTNLTDDEISHNKDLFEEKIANEFPEEDMLDKSFRDKVM